MGYRETYFNNTPSFFGKYRCGRCGGLFAKKDIDIDHRIPKRKGGTDDLYNLQAMCKHCNRSKGKNQSNLETAETLVRAAMTGNLGGAAKGIASRKIKDAFGVKYKR